MRKLHIFGLRPKISSGNSKGESSLKPQSLDSAKPIGVKTEGRFGKEASKPKLSDIDRAVTDEFLVYIYDLQ